MGMNLSNVCLKRSLALSVIAHVNVLKNALLTLGKDELQAMKDEDHGAEIVCQFCQTKYEFSEADLEELINDKLNSSFMIGNVGRFLIVQYYWQVLPTRLSVPLPKNSVLVS